MNKLFFLVVSALFLSGCNRIDVHQPLTSALIPLTAGETVSQTFVANHDNLNIVRICLRNPDRVQTSIRFSLLAEEQEIRGIDFNSSNIDNTDCTRLQFAPIPNSAGQTFVASIMIYPREEASLPFTPIYVEKYGQDLHFSTNYYQSLPSTLHESWTQFLHRLTLDPAFLIPYLLLIIIIIIYLCCKNSRSRS